MAGTEHQHPRDAVDAAFAVLKDTAAGLPGPGDGGSGDAAVVAAVQLGWLVEDVVCGRAIAPLDGQEFDDPTVGFRAQGVRLERLADLLELTQEGIRAAAADLGEGRPCANVSTWPALIEARLLGRDARLARGLLIGRALNRLRHAAVLDDDVSEQEARAHVDQLLADDALTQLVDRLDQLASALPPHAARAVCKSVRRWRDATPAQRPLDVLPGQVDHWYRLLTGQKRGVDTLEPANYVDAAFSLGRKTMTSVGDALRPVWPVLALAALMLAGGVALLVFTDVGDAVGVTTLIASFGLSWKAVGGTLGRLAARLEAPLWNAELDAAVCQAITLGLPCDPKDKPRTLRQLRKQVDGGDYAGRTARVEELAS
jgi:hypothetical protein